MKVDVAIIGGGIAGLSCAAALGDSVAVAVIEAEPTFGYHATGRSAALYTECYGSTVIRRLARASRPYLDERGLLSARGMVYVAPAGRSEMVERLAADFSRLVPDLERLPPEALAERCELFPATHTGGAVLEPAAADIDVDGLQGGYVTASRTSGHAMLTSNPVSAIVRTPNGWIIEAGDHRIEASVVVNAAGAWADEIAACAGIETLGLTPMLRSVFTFDPGADPRDWPMIVDADETWYIKPEGQHMLGSAASEIPHEPADVRAPELDVALGIERINAATDLSIRSVKSTWAGLRTFTADRTPAVGFEPADEAFFWLVGQGGYGIKTSPAIADIAAELILGGSRSEWSDERAQLVSALDPGRLRS